jgi:hypothetical protein
VTEVVPGSADDPFSVNFKGSQPTDQSAPVTEPPVSQPDEPKSSDAVVDIAALLKNPDVIAAIGKQVDARVSEAQKGLNKRDALVTKQLKDSQAELAKAQENMTRLQREAQLANLSTEERARLQQEWHVEDEMKKVRDAHAKTVEYHRGVEALRLVTEYGAFGFTPEMIEDDDSLEDMAVKARDAKIAFLQAGGKVPDEKPVAPAAASAASDLGGGGPAPKEFKLGTAQGVDAMAANLKALIERPEQVR